MTWGSNKVGLNYDFMLEVAKGNVVGHAIVNAQGRAPAGLQTTATDLWDRADASPTQQTLTSPTAARVHAMVSGSANDAAAGTGARTIRVYGLTSWTAAEVSEDVILNGTNAVNTVNSYVHINKVKCLTFGSGGTNAGAITATAATNSTVSAHMLAGLNETQMAIYGLPSVQSAYILDWYAGIKSATTTIVANLFLMVAENAASYVLDASYLPKHNMCLASLSNNSGRHVFAAPLKIAGPAIIKIRGTVDANDVDCAGGFNLVLVNN